MPKYRDTVTGQVKEFDHEPSIQELDREFGNGAGISTPGSSFSSLQPVHSAEQDKGAAPPGLGGMVGGVVGGKVGGKIGAGIGAAAGTGFGDIYNMLTHGVGDTTPASEASRLAGVAGVTSGLEFAAPPILRALGSVKDMLPKGGSLMGGGGLGWLFGHPGAGAAIGAGVEAAPKVADAIDWLGTPYAPKPPTPPVSEGVAKAMAAMVKAGVDPASPEAQQWLSQVSSPKGKILGGPSQPPTPQGPQAPGFMSKLGSMAESAGEGISNAGSAAMKGLKNGWNALDSYMTTNPPPTGNPDTVKGVVDYAGERASELNAGGIPRKPAMQAASKEAGWPLGASAEKGPYEYPKFGGKDVPEFSSDDVSQTLKDFPEAFSSKPEAPLTNQMQGLTDPHSFGPNTVGAAQKPPYFPGSVAENKGLSFADANAWDAAKRGNPALTDSNLDDWFRSNKLGGNENVGKSPEDLQDALMGLLGRSLKRP